MSEYEKVSLLYLAHISSLLHAQGKEVMQRNPEFFDWLRRDLEKDIREVASVETLTLLGAPTR